MLDTTQEFDNFIEPHIKCFDSFDIKNDIIELQNDGFDAVSIYVDLIFGANTTRLLFGQNTDKQKLTIDGHYPKCNKDEEVATFIQIKNASIYASTCSKFDFMSFDTRCQLILEFLFFKCQSRYGIH